MIDGGEPGNRRLSLLHQALRPRSVWLLREAGLTESASMPRVSAAAAVIHSWRRLPVLALDAVIAELHSFADKPQTLVTLPRFAQVWGTT